MEGACPICMDPVGSTGGKIARLSCGHCLCEACRQDLQKKARAPDPPDRDRTFRVTRRGLAAGPQPHCPLCRSGTLDAVAIVNIDPMAPTVPVALAAEAAPPIEPLNDLRDLSGDAMTTSQAISAERKRRAAGGSGPQVHFPQCSLSAVRNLLRNERLPRSFLATRQIGLGVGAIDAADQGDAGDIRYPDWPAILTPLAREGEVVVRFDPTRFGSELLHDARLMACAYLETTHVIAIFRHDTPVGGRVTFRKYDNDSMTGGSVAALVSPAHLHRAASP